MIPDTVVRALALCVALAGTETLHGIARTVLLVPRLGKELALKLSIFSGSVLAFLVCWFLVPGIGLTTLPEHLALGLLLALFMASFDVALGGWLLRRKWSNVLQDFNPSTGNYLVFGLALLVIIPALVHQLRPGE